MRAPMPVSPVQRTGLRALTVVSTLAAALCLLSGCNESNLASGGPSDGYGSRATRSVQSGTRIRVALGSDISSETAHVGDAWHGTVSENVATINGGSIPPGSDVDGVVVGVTPAKRGSRAMLELGIRSIRVNGRNEPIGASAAPVVAGSTRARNVGAVAGGTLVGALIGNNVGDGRNATAGGVIGGVATAAAVATTNGYQVVLSDGAVMSFTVSRTVAIR
jgi:outer membrane lipoprotein SlyB